MKPAVITANNRIASLQATEPRIKFLHQQNHLVFLLETDAWVLLSADEMVLLFGAGCHRR